MRKQRQNYNPNGRKTRTKFDIRSDQGSNGVSNKEYRDPFRNGEIPLCRLLNDAIEDIFPELRDQVRNSKRGNNSGHSPQQQSQYESGSVLGQMIRRKYLLARKSYRTSLETKFKQDNTDEDNAWEFNRNNINFQNNNNSNTNDKNKNPNNDITPPASTSTKKRRKRKKKRKNESDGSFLPSVISHETGGSHFRSEPCPSSRNGVDSYLTDGKSMMSITDHSLEALDEAVKNEAEKLIELEANHEMPLLGSFPSDDDIQAQESPSQFIDQIKPQNENLLQHLPDHTDPPPFSDEVESTTLLPSLPADSVPAKNENSEEIKWKDPLKLDFLVNFERTKDTKTLTATTSDKERTRIVFHEWIDQFFFVNDEYECIETSVAAKDQEDSDSRTDEWDSFLQFCNERTSGREKALGIAIQELSDNASSIDSRVCREETLAEINKIARKSSRIVMNPTVLEKAAPPSNDEMNIDTAFDYVALEEGNHIPKNNNEEQDEEKSDSNISFLAADVTIDPKQMKGNKKKTQSGNAVAATNRCLYLETLTSAHLEEFLCEWLIAGVDEEKLVQMSIRKETEPCENDIGKIALPVVTSDFQFQEIKNGVIKTQQSIRENLDNMNSGLEEMRTEWRSKEAMTSIEKNLDFSGNNTMETCEESCNDYLCEDILPILTGEFSLPSHACAELQIHLWAIYLEGVGKTLNACDAYYKKLEEDLADQNGKLPFIFTSAPFRKIYRELAEEKIGFLLEMGKSFSAASASCSMRDFYTRCSWEQSKRDTQDTSSQKLDEDCRELIIELTEWTRIVNGGRMSAINKGRSKRLLTVFELLGDVVESLGEAYKTVEGYFSQDRQNYFTRLLSDIYLAHGVKDRMRLLEMDDVISLTTGIILMWRHVRIMQSRVGRTTSTDILPLSLRKWVLEPEKDQFSPDFVHSKYWYGVGGGRRRAMGILAGLTYVWFRERCKEWKAEKASQELLTYLDEDLLSSENPSLANTSNTSKSSKKAKKKKNKKSSSSFANGSSNNPATTSVEKTDEALSISMLNKADAEEDLKSPEGAEQESTDDILSPTMCDVVSVDRGTNPDNHTVTSDEKEKADTLNVNEATETNDRGDGIEFLACEKDDNSTQPFESLVVVQDEAGCIVTAMEFLTGRLVELMRHPDNEQIIMIPDYDGETH